MSLNILLMTISKNTIFQRTLQRHKFEENVSYKIEKTSSKLLNRKSVKTIDVALRIRTSQYYRVEFSGTYPVIIKGSGPLTVAFCL